VVGVLLVKVSSCESGLAGWPGRLADCGELRAEKRRDDSFPESGTGVIGIGVSVRFGWRRIVRAPGYPDDTPYDLDGTLTTRLGVLRSGWLGGYSDCHASQYEAVGVYGGC
jgi:hypothetical protein